MRIGSFPSLIMLALLLPLMAADASAQRNLVANIPFDFTVCREQLPAGKYRVESITSASGAVLLVKSDDNRTAEIICTHGMQSSKQVDQGKLIFNRYGEQYFLSEIWFAGERTGNQLVKTEREEALLGERAPQRKREKVTIKITEAKPK